LWLYCETWSCTDHEQPAGFWANLAGNPMIWQAAWAPKLDCNAWTLEDLPACHGLRIITERP
jgi:hypothetical protein